MRKVTRNIVGVLSLGVLATSWSLGQAAETGLSLNPQTPTNTDTPSATPSASATDTPTVAPPVENGGTAPSAQPTASATTSPASVTKTSAAVSYIAKDRQGVMQLSVTKSGSKITAVTIISGGTEGGEWAGIPDQLAAAAVQSQGAHFGNVTRATHTTDAFYQALDSALAKF